MRNIILLVAGLALVGGCASTRTRPATDGESADAAVIDDVALAVESAAPIDLSTDPFETTGETAEPVEPSLTGFDRSHWPTLVVHPESGTVQHGPAYLGGQFTPTLDQVELSELTVEQRVDLALAPAYEGSRWAALLWEPVRFGGQVLTLPATLVTQSPFSRAASPARGGSAASASSPQRGGLTRGQGATGQPSSGAGGLGTGAGSDSGTGTGTGTGSGTGNIGSGTGTGTSGVGAGGATGGGR